MTSRNVTSSLGSKHAPTANNRSLEGVGVSVLRRTGPQNRANLAELYQEINTEVEDGAGGGKGKSSTSSGGGIKDKTELKASIRSLKENNEALQDINRNLEQKLFQVS